MAHFSATLHTVYIGGFFRGPIFSPLGQKPDRTHVGALREEGVAPKISPNIFSRLAEIREIRQNKINVREKNPAIRYHLLL